ncbi:MAG: MBL fold metallo-hydrolase [Betaproteobacteria bacterium]|nr:MBL fold metallo-hydrolase [Betaproteobacteria bacterium]
MTFRQLFDPASSTYTYLIADDTNHEAVLIDSVIDQVARDLALLRDNGLTLRYTLDTHVHADHVTAAHAIKQALAGGAARPAGVAAVQTAVSRDCNAAGYDRYLGDGDVILFGREEILVIATPGHTAGSVSFLWRDHVFTGDALLIGGCGRTDFQSGSAEALYHSITQKLFTLDEQVLVYPGRDYKGRRVSSIGEEKLFNARLAGKSLKEFVAIMDSLGPPAPARIHEAVPVNLVRGTELPPALSGQVPREAAALADLDSISVRQFSDEWQSPALRRRTVLIDVRTPAEFAIEHVEGAQSLPLDQLDPAALMARVGPAHTVFCICQTGTRSQLAAARLREAGFAQVVHVDGGTNAWRTAGLPLVRASP